MRGRWPATCCCVGWAPPLPTVWRNCRRRNRSAETQTDIHTHDRCIKLTTLCSHGDHDSLERPARCTLIGLEMWGAVTWCERTDRRTDISVSSPVWLSVNVLVNRFVVLFLLYLNLYRQTERGLFSKQ